MDLFGWVGASNTTWTGAAQYGISSSKTLNDYGTVANEGLKSDWGTLAINTYPANTWRTLTGGTNGEWYYLFNNRPGGTVNGVNNARYTPATINTGSKNVHGLILFPDGVEIAAGEVNLWGDINAKSDWGTQCNADQWTALADKGCIFLPAAGYRYGTELYDVGSSCYYWSSTSLSDGENASYYAYNMYFSPSGGLSSRGYSTRRCGRSVRLVCDAN